MLNQVWMNTEYNSNQKEIRSVRADQEVTRTVIVWVQFDKLKGQLTLSLCAVLKGDILCFFGDFNLIYILLWCWMSMLNMFKVTKPEINARRNPPCKSKAQASTCSQHFSCNVLFYLAVTCTDVFEKLTWKKRKKTLTKSKEREKEVNSYYCFLFT